MSGSRCEARLLGGEKVAVLCCEFDISRKTDYMIYQLCQRYKDCGGVRRDRSQP